MEFNKELFMSSIDANLRLSFGKTVETARIQEKYFAVAKAIMYMISNNWISTQEAYKKGKNAYYFSLEFLVGRSLGNNLVNLQIYEDVKSCLEEIGVEINYLEEMEEDAALGNGGLGRLAACFMESAATLNLPLTGYGLRYKEGLLKQVFKDGFQTEIGDEWIKHGDPWSIRMEADKQTVEFRDFKVKAVPYDMPIIGFQTKNINTIRLWQSEAIEEFNLSLFNEYKYDEAVSSKNRAEDITRVLYPNDSQRVGKVLRLMQQYFFVSASLKDIIKKHKEKNSSVEDLAKDTRIQLNDTHPVIAIAELIRILVDYEKLSLEESLLMAREIFSYTNHTILSEALEKWNIDIVREVSPRCFEIIEWIDGRLMDELRAMGKESFIDSMRIIKDGVVHMAHLGIYACHTVNGVAKLHTDILKNDVLKLWNDVYPEKIQNKTNGITPRRWLVLSNPELASLLTEKLGSDSWIKNMDELKKLEYLAQDEEFLKRLIEVKKAKKIQLAKYIKEHEGVDVNPDSLFDIQVKRMHEYKRQLLNALHIVYLYKKLKKNPDLDIVPRTFIFGGKSAPGYFRAKAIIKFINEIAKKVNSDEEIRGKIKVVFVENYRVSYGERLFPAADISEQISTAGKEASGTGNMKFMMNATPTIGTYDGANVEIVKEAGSENNFIFGARVEELNAIRDSYNPLEYYMKDFELKETVDSLMTGEFTDNDTFMFLDIYNGLLSSKDWNKPDCYFVLLDFRAYLEEQEKVDRAYRDRIAYARKGFINLINSGKFSSDRTIKDYASEIWGIDETIII